MDGQTTFLDEFNATAPDLSRDINVMVCKGGGSPGPISSHFFDAYQASNDAPNNIELRMYTTAYGEVV